MGDRKFEFVFWTGNGLNFKILNFRYIGGVFTAKISDTLIQKGYITRTAGRKIFNSVSYKYGPFSVIGSPVIN